MIDFFSIEIKRKENDWIKEIIIIEKAVEMAGSALFFSLVFLPLQSLKESRRH